MAKERRLGRGLELLLGGIGGGQEPRTQESAQGGPFPAETDTDWLLQQKLAAQTPGRVDILQIDRNPFQPRQEFDEVELDQLADNLEAHGLLQPIVVRKTGDRFQIVAGERRFRAATRLGWTEVDVHCIEVDDRQMIELALTENLQRKDLNPLEKAASFARYLESYGGTHDELARRLGLDRSTVTNLMRLLELPAVIQDAVRKGDLSQGHARALLPLKEWEWEQTELAARIQAEGWSVRATERYVRELVEGVPEEQPASWNVVGTDGQKRPVPTQSEQILRLEQDFRERLGGMKVKLTQANEKGKGKLVISFADHAEFERIYAAICQGGLAAHG